MTLLPPVVGLAFREYNSALQFGHRVVLPNDVSDLQLLVHAGGAADSPLLPLEAARRTGGRAMAGAIRAVAGIILAGGAWRYLASCRVGGRDLGGGEPGARFTGAIS